MIDFFHSSSSQAMPDNDALDKKLATEKDVEHTLKMITKAYGLRSFLVLTLPSNACETLMENTILTDWPQEMVEGYDQALLFQGSPVIERLNKGTVPFHFDAGSTNRKRSDGKGDIAVSLFEAFNLSRGAYFPALEVDGHRGAIAFAGEREKLREEEMLQLNLISNYIFNRLGQLRKMREPAPASLSHRELECLYWVAAGKTSVEIAGILDLSEHTVNHYLNRAGRKLDAVNRVQAVAKAYRAGLIH